MSVRIVNGKNVLVAVGAKNLGGLISRDMAAQGAKAVAVHYLGLDTKQQAEEARAAVKSARANGICTNADLTSASDVEKTFADVHKAFGRLILL